MAQKWWTVLSPTTRWDARWHLMMTTVRTGFTSSTSWGRWLFCLATLSLRCLWTKLVVCPCWVRIEATDKAHMHSSNCFFFCIDCGMWKGFMLWIHHCSCVCHPAQWSRAAIDFRPMIYLNIIQPTITYSNTCSYCSCAPIRWLYGAFRHQLLLPVVWHQRVHDDFHVVPLQRPEHLCLELPGCGHDRIVPHC